MLSRNRCRSEQKHLHALTSRSANSVMMWPSKSEPYSQCLEAMFPRPTTDFDIRHRDGCIQSVCGRAAPCCLPPAGVRKQQQSQIPAVHGKTSTFQHDTSRRKLPLRCPGLHQTDQPHVMMWSSLMNGPCILWATLQPTPEGHSWPPWRRLSRGKKHGQNGQKRLQRHNPWHRWVFTIQTQSLICTTMTSWAWRPRT